MHSGELYARVDTCSMSAVTVVTAVSYHASNLTDSTSGPHTNEVPFSDHSHKAAGTGSYSTHKLTIKDHQHTTSGANTGNVVSPYSSGDNPNLEVEGNTGQIYSGGSPHKHQVPALVNSTSTIFTTTGQTSSSVNTDTHAQQDFTQTTGVFYAKWVITINTSAVVTAATLDVVRTAVGGTAPTDVPFGALTEGSGTLSRAATAARTGTFYREIGTVTSSSVTQVMNDNVHWSMFVLPEVS